MSLAQSEPERTRLILKVGAAGLLGVALWTAAAPAVIPTILTVLVTMMLLGAYAALLVVLTGRLVHDADRWEVESAMQARRLLMGHAEANGGRPAAGSPSAAVLSAEEGEKHPALMEDDGSEEAASFHQLYFVLRLEQEVRRCRREGETISAVVVQVKPAGVGRSPSQLEKMSLEIAKLASNYVTTIVSPSCIGPSEYAFYLPNANRAAAKAAVLPLLKVLGDYHCDLGIASYPGDGGDALALITRAREQLDQNVLTKTA